MPFRLAVAALLAASLMLPGVAFAKEPADSTAKPSKEPSVGQSAARERQKKCGAQWRALSATEKTAQGPKWPQYYSKCVKRLKEQKA